MPKVYITNRGGHDFEPAKKFGEPIFCTEGSLPRYGVNQMYRELREVMRDSDKEDMILVTSLTVLNCVACALFAFKHGRLNLLLYRPSGDEYIKRTVIFD